MADESVDSPGLDPTASPASAQVCLRWDYIMLHQVAAIFGATLVSPLQDIFSLLAYAVPVVIGALPLAFLLHPPIARDEQLAGTWLVSAMIGVPLGVLVAFGFWCLIQMLGVVRAIG
jgi:hypothetical protein